MNQDELEAENERLLGIIEEARADCEMTVELHSASLIGSSREEKGVKLSRRSKSSTKAYGLVGASECDLSIS